MGSRLTPVDERVSFEELPGLPRLFLDCVRRAASSEPFCPCPPLPESLVTHAARRRAAPLARLELAAVLEREALEFGSGEEARSNLRRLQSADTVVVVASVPAAPLGGPMSVLVEALSAIQAAARLEREGAPAVPLVWIAPGASESAAPDWLDDTGRLVRATEAALGEAEGRHEETVELIHRCYAPGTAPALALARLLAAVTRPWGLVVADGAAPEWRALALPWLRQAVERAPEIARLAREQGERLAAAGYAAGPEPPLFELDGAPVAHDAIASLMGSGRIRPGEVLAPVCMASLLPVAAHVSGPAGFETFARALGIYREFELDPPLVLPRASATLLDPRSRRTLEKYGCRLPDLYAGPDAVVERLASGTLDPDLPARFDALASQLDRRLAKLQEVLGGERGGSGEHSGLSDEIASSRSRMLYQIQKLRERAVAAQALRREIMTRQIARACDALAPGGALQEDRIAAAYFLVRYSAKVLQVVYDSIDVWTHEHRIVGID